MATNTFHSCSTCNARIHSIFHKLEAPDLEIMDSIKACKVFKKGETVFAENGNPLGLFCINHGKIKLSVAGINGKEQIIRLLKDGDVVGYRALLSEERYHCSAIALDDCSICFIPKSSFFSLVQQNANVNAELLRLLSKNLKHAEEQVVAMAQKNVRERMAEALLFFKASYGVNEKDGNLNINFSREEIANFVGTSTETAIRLLSEFQQDGIIEVKAKKIRIAQIARLTQTANLDD